MPQDVSKMTAEDLNELFMEAAQTERYMPGVYRRQNLSSWPDYVQSWSSYGWSDVKQVRIQPTATQIDRLYTALDLGLRMGKDDRKIIWAAAHSAVGRERGPQWTKLGKMLGRSRRSVKNEYIAALVRLTWIIKKPH